MIRQNTTFDNATSDFETEDLMCRLIEDEDDG